MSCATHCWFNSPQGFFLQSHTPPATPPSLRLSSAASPPASQSAAAACPDASCFHSPARTRLRRSRRILSSTDETPSAANSACRRCPKRAASRSDVFSKSKLFLEACNCIVLSSRDLRRVYLNGGLLHFRLRQDRQRHQDTKKAANKFHFLFPKAAGSRNLLL